MLCLKEIGRVMLSPGQLVFLTQ